MLSLASSLSLVRETFGVFLRAVQFVSERYVRILQRRIVLPGEEVFCRLCFFGCGCDSTASSLPITNKQQVR